MCAFTCDLMWAAAAIPAANAAALQPLLHFNERKN